MLEAVEASNPAPYGARLAAIIWGSARRDYLGLGSPRLSEVGTIAFLIAGVAKQVVQLRPREHLRDAIALMPLF